MKKEKFGFNGMSFMTLILAVALFSLAVLPVSAQTELEGSWTHSNPDSNEATWTFSGNSFTYKAGGEVQYEGTFTTKKKSMTLNLSNGGELTAAYTIKDNFLDLKQPKAKKGTSDYSGLYGWFINNEAVKAVIDEYQSITPDSTPTVIEGKWKHPNTASKKATFTFSGNSFTYTQGTFSTKGRFILDGKNITLISEDGWFKWTTQYSVTKTQLDFKQGKGGFGWYGAFNKQK
jgi:hypothetical protein